MTAPAGGGRALRPVAWAGIFLGTAGLVTACWYGWRPRIPGPPAFLGLAAGAVLAWLVFTAAAAVAAELVRRHHKQAAAAAGRGGKRAAVAAARGAGSGYRSAAARAASRWQSRGQPPPLFLTRTQDPPAPPSPEETGHPSSRQPGDTPMDKEMTEDEIKQQVLSKFHPDDHIEPSELIVGKDGSITLDRRRKYPWAQPMIVAWKGGSEGAAKVQAARESGYPISGYDGSPAARRQDGLPETCEKCGDLIRRADDPGEWGAGWVHVGSDAICAGMTGVARPSGKGSPGLPGTRNPAPAAHGGTQEDQGDNAMAVPGDQSPLSGPAVRAGVPGPWKQVAADTGDFEPENDGELLEWMACEVAGISAYAEALTEVYETCVNSLGVDPAAMNAIHDTADAAADAATAMAYARQKFASHYAEVREFAASGGQLPYNGRWIQGEGDA